MYAYSEHKQVSALRFAFKFPLALALDDVGLADSSNHAPERVFEQALTGVVDWLNAIETYVNEQVHVVPTGTKGRSLITPWDNDSLRS